MMQDSLARALGGLKGARMDDVAAEEIRKRLQLAWTERAARRRSRFGVPGLARAFGVAALVVLVAFSTMRATADSALYGARIAVEDALVSFQSDPVEYLTQLYTERLEEAARFEASGNALAASRARTAQSEALQLLGQISPEQSPEPSASTAITLPSPSPSPEVTASPTESPTPVPTATPPPTTVRTAIPKPATSSPSPTPKPSLTPTPTPISVHAFGYVLYADGSPVDGACVSMTLDGICVAGSIKGRVDLQFPARKGQSITLYFRNYDASRGGTLHGKVTVTVSGPEVALGIITLR